MDISKLTCKDIFKILNNHERQLIISRNAEAYLVSNWQDLDDKDDHAIYNKIQKLKMI